MVDGILEAMSDKARRAMFAALRRAGGGSLLKNKAVQMQLKMSAMGRTTVKPGFKRNEYGPSQRIKWTRKELSTKKDAAVHSRERIQNRATLAKLGPRDVHPNKNVTYGGHHFMDRAGNALITQPPPPGNSTAKQRLQMPYRKLFHAKTGKELGDVHTKWKGQALSYVVTHGGKKTELKSHKDVAKFAARLSGTKKLQKWHNFI
jgi:hypothetical protein